MKKNLVKVLTLALAAATVASMSALTMPVYAEETPTISVTNVSDPNAANLTVTAYQIVKVNATSGAYELCDATNAKIANPEQPTSEEVITIAKNIRDNAANLTAIKMTKENGTNTYKATNVEAGLYIVLASGADAVVYNPALVAWNVKEPRNNSVDMKTKFAFDSDAYLKASESGFDKSIVDSSMNNTEGDAVAFGDTVKFKLDKMTIPYYSDDYTSVMYTIEDNLDPSAFQGVKNISVKVGGKEVALNETDYTLTYNGIAAGSGTTGSSGSNATNFKIEFTDKFIRDNAEKSVEITYDSVLMDTAGLNYAENKNTATLKYSNDPSDATKYKEKTDTTYHYTFGIDADVDAQDPSPDKDTETYELNKVTDAGETFETATNTAGKSTMRSPKKLAGAEFALYSDEAMTTTVRTATSDANGHIQFKGLDTGTYYMKETKAPATYTLNTNIYKIEIAATLNEEGVMTQYSITTTLSTDNGKTYTACGDATYTNTPVVNADDTVTNSIVPTVTPVEIVDTQLAALPATGGEGTIAITIGGALGMAGFLTLYITNKKKKKAE